MPRIPKSRTTGCNLLEFAASEPMPPNFEKESIFRYTIRMSLWNNKKQEAQPVSAKSALQLLAQKFQAKGDKAHYDPCIAALHALKDGDPVKPYEFLEQLISNAGKLLEETPESYKRRHVMLSIKECTKHVEEQKIKAERLVKSLEPVLAHLKMEPKVQAMLRSRSGGSSLAENSLPNPPQTESSNSSSSSFSEEYRAATSDKRKEIILKHFVSCSIEPGDDISSGQILQLTDNRNQIHILHILEVNAQSGLKVEDYVTHKVLQSPISFSALNGCAANGRVRLLIPCGE